MSTRTTSGIADALQNVLVSPNVSDANGEAANLVDVFDEISRCLWLALAPESEHGLKRTNMIREHGEAIKDAAMRIEIGLDGIAEAITDLAAAIRGHKG